MSDIYKTDESLYRFADTVGDGSGTKNIIADYSTPTPFMVKPPATQIYRLERMIIHIEDDAQVTAEKYGGLAALTNGLKIRVMNSDGVVLDLLNGLTIKSNGHFGKYCYDVNILDFAVGNKMVSSRWTFSKSGRPLDVSGYGGEFLEILAQDDFQGLIDNSFQVQGYIVTP